VSCFDRSLYKRFRRRHVVHRIRDLVGSVGFTLNFKPKIGDVAVPDRALLGGDAVVAVKLEAADENGVHKTSLALCVTPAGCVRSGGN